MKNISILFLSILLLSACKNSEKKDFVTLSGNIENNTDSIIRIFNREGIVKEFAINKDGSFKDTLKVKEAAIYNFTTESNKNVPIFLKNGYDISIKGEASDFFETFVFSGEGAENSNFIIAQIKQSRSLGDPKDILALESSEFQKKLNQIKNSYDSILHSYKNLDSTLFVNVKSQNQQLIGYFESAYAKNQIMGEGKPSPKFENYVDYKGGKKSLDSFIGKYVYIDVWATWCGPCIAQFPYLKELKTVYKNKNIVFVGISTDEDSRNGGSWEAAEKKWRDFVKEKNLGDVQLWSGRDFSFQQAYEINAIPRFILIDPDGKIVSADAPRPSDPNLRTLLDSFDL
ncbi:TlpA family protein disulfide reductase [Polaribacter gangjinensis]|uniref:Redoxin n=1 Tax=Polaribacter gangjinensis TaxID=574710 RepID=A0A2S7WBG6_9FLAO|nr:TlpA disulfide reductase family protein [Polaribacter gangjinensis]PQJ74746.1 redoxin [Polaribacter gangjinensis]